MFIEAYVEPSRTMEFLAKIKRLQASKCFCKNVSSLMFDRALNTPLVL